LELAALFSSRIFWVLLRFGNGENVFAAATPLLRKIKAFGGERSENDPRPQLNIPFPSTADDLSQLWRSHIRIRVAYFQAG
jgi:hypothetical protein